MWQTASIEALAPNPPYGSASLPPEIKGIRAKFTITEKKTGLFRPVFLF